MSLKDRLKLAAEKRLASDEGGPWRCFHCGALCETRAEAVEHFGTSEMQQAICTVTAERYREVEAQLEEYRNESDATSRTFYEMGHRAAEAERAAEQKGYDRGIADAKAHPEELGLMHKGNGGGGAGAGYDQLANGGSVDPFS